MKRVLLINLLLISSFCWAQTPTITSVTPSTVSICGGEDGTLLTINGSNFQTQGGNSQVTIGSVDCIIYSWTNTRIYCYPGSSIATYSGTITVTNNSNKSVTYMLTKFVYPTPSTLIDALATFPTIDCGDTTTLIASATNGNTEWYTDYCGGNYVGKGVTLKVTPTITTTYYARNVSFISTGGCASACRYVTVTVNGSCQVQPVISLIPNNACIGSLVTISGTGFTGVNSVSFNGVNAVDFTVVSDNSITATVPVGATTGTIAVTNSSGTGTSAGNITIAGAAPAIVSPPGDKTICSSQPSVSFKVGATGIPLPAYQWRKNGNNISNATDSVFTILSPSVADSGNYDVVLTNSCGEVTSQPARLTVNAVPVITVQPLAKDVCAAQPASFSTTATSATSYQWVKNGISLQDAEDSTLDISSASVSDTGWYQVIASNGCGADTSTAVSMNVRTLPLADITAADSIICDGDSAQICLQNTAATYTWSNGGDGACIYAKSSGVYEVTVTGANGCSATSPQVNIGIFALPTVSVSVNNDTLVSSPAITYQWQLNGNDISNANAQTYIARQSGNYTVIVSNASGCKNTSEAVQFGITQVVELNTGTTFGIYPNPVGGSQVQLKVSSELVGQRCLVMDVNGKIVISKIIRHVNETLDVSLFSKGLYLVKINGEVRKLICQ